MKVCMMAAASSIHTVRWANALAQRGHDVHLVTMHHMSIHTLDEQVTVHSLKVPAPLGYYLNMFQAKKIVNTLKPDLLHVHYASGYGTLARLISYKPTLLSVWGSDVYLFPYKSKRNEKILRKNLQFAHHITATGDALKRQTEQFITTRNDIDIVPFGIDVTQFKKENKQQNNKLTIGTVKGLKHVYGIDILLRAFAQLVDKLKHNNEHSLVDQLQLMIVGEGPLLNELQQLAKKLNIDHLTKFIGAVPNEEVPTYLNKLDIYCAFSRSESFGVAILEASSCEVPVIVSNVGGLPEVVQHEKTGYILSNDHPDKIVDTLYTLVKNEKLRKQLGQSGRQFVETTYDWDVNVTEMEQVYQSFLKRINN